MKRTAISAIIVFLGTLMFASSALAWARHELLTTLALEAMAQSSSPAARVLAAGLRDEYVLVTAYTETDETINPAYRPDYVNPNREQRQPDGRYVYFDLQSPRLGYRGAAVGEIMCVADILIWYSDEPDWGMDRDLNGGVIAKLMGGTQGMRHMFYPRGNWHLPKAFLDQGTAPERFAHFIAKARQAFTRGDTYWGWRHLARALHYLQDLSQPFHTTQAPWSYYDWKSLINGTIETTTNYHFAYESLVANLLEQWRRGETQSRQLVNRSELFPTGKEASRINLNLRRVARETIRRQGEFFALTKPLLGTDLQARKPVVYQEKQYRETLSLLARTDEGREFLRLTLVAVRHCLATTWALLEEATY